MFTMMLVWMGCAEVEDAALPVDEAPPPAVMALSSFGTLQSGQTFGLSVTGAPANAPVTLVAGRGAPGVDVGVCPAPLAGICLDFLPGPAGYTLLSTGTSSSAGTYDWQGTVPSGIPAGTWRFQAVAGGPTLGESNVVAVYAGCVDDSAEPDDRRGTAGALGTGARGRVLCPTNQDFYSLSVGRGEAVEIQVSFSTGDGDIDIELEDASGVVLDGSYMLRSPEVVRWYNSGPPKTVFLQVWSVTDTDGDGIPYAVDVSRLTPQPCLPDPFEPDDTPGQAARVTTLGATGRRACYSDSDWYVVNVAAGSNLTVDVLEAAGSGDARVRLFDAALNPLIATPADPADIVAPGGDVYVEVVLFADDIAGGGADYTLDIDVWQVHACATDALEPNDSLGTAVTITTGSTYLDLEVCSSDSDWYRFPVTAGRTIDVDLSFPVSDGDIDARLYGPSLSQVAVGVAGGDNEVFSHTATVTGTYTLEVYLYGDYGPPVTGGAAYDMEISLR